MNMSRLLFALIALPGLAGCIATGDPVDPSRRTVAAVAGQVTRTDGSKVGGPLVSVTLFGQVTGGSAKLVGQSNVLADNDGRFLFVFITNEAVQIGTADVSVTPPIGSGLLPRDTTGIPVRFVQGQVATDTAYVQLVLPPR